MDVSLLSFKNFCCLYFIFLLKNKCMFFLDNIFPSLKKFFCWIFLFGNMLWLHPLHFFGFRFLFKWALFCFYLIIIIYHLFASLSSSKQLHVLTTDTNKQVLYVFWNYDRRLIFIFQLNIRNKSDPNEIIRNNEVPLKALIQINLVDPTDFGPDFKILHNARGLKIR